MATAITQGKPVVKKAEREMAKRAMARMESEVRMLLSHAPHYGKVAPGKGKRPTNITITAQALGDLLFGAYLDGYAIRAAEEGR